MRLLQQFFVVTVLVWRVPSRDENFLVVEDRVCSRQWYFVDLCGVSCEMLAEMHRAVGLG